VEIRAGRAFHGNGVTQSLEILKSSLKALPALAISFVAEFLPAGEGTHLRLVPTQMPMQAVRRGSELRHL